MQRFRSKSHTICAQRYDANLELDPEDKHMRLNATGKLTIRSADGRWQLVSPGDWVVRLSQREGYIALSSTAFRQHYERDE